MRKRTDSEKQKFCLDIRKILVDKIFFCGICKLLQFLNPLSISWFLGSEINNNITPTLFNLLMLLPIFSLLPSFILIVSWFILVIPCYLFSIPFKAKGDNLPIMSWCYYLLKYGVEGILLNIACLFTCGCCCYVNLREFLDEISELGREIYSPYENVPNEEFITNMKIELNSSQIIIERLRFINPWTLYYYVPTDEYYHSIGFFMWFNVIPGLNIIISLFNMILYLILLPFCFILSIFLKYKYISPLRWILANILINFMSLLYIPYLFVIDNEYYGRQFFTFIIGTDKLNQFEHNSFELRPIEDYIYFFCELAKQLNPVRMGYLFMLEENMTFMDIISCIPIISIIPGTFRLIFGFFIIPIGLCITYFYYFNEKSPITYGYYWFISGLLSVSCLFAPVNYFWLYKHRHRLMSVKEKIPPNYEEILPNYEDIV